MRDPRLAENAGANVEVHFLGVVQHMNANVEETLDGVPVPSHLLVLHHSLGDDLRVQAATLSLLVGSLAGQSI